jgi:hypothetical protein
MFDPSQHQHYERDRLNSTRQAAEALFAPKRQVTEQSIRESAPPAGEAVRKPRVLAISSTAPVHHEELAAPISPKQEMPPKIARAQFARIRAWVKYGMTPRQVAEVYGVAVGEIERILRIV